jgi:hypothetical protein
LFFEKSVVKKAKRQPEVVGVGKLIGRILRGLNRFCFASRKKIRNRLQAATEALRNIDRCRKNQQKACKNCAFTAQLSEKDG